MTTSVAIVGNDRLFTAEVKAILDGSNEVACLAVCASVKVARELLPALDPQVVLVGDRLSRATSADCVQLLKQSLPDTHFLLISTTDDTESVYQSLKAGASGYLLKTSAPGEVLAAIREVCTGGAPMSAAIARKVVDAFRQFFPLCGRVDGLSRRESEVLTALASGREYKEVAELMGIAYDTVRTHAHNIYRKLHVHSLREAEQILQEKAGSASSAKRTKEAVPRTPGRKCPSPPSR